MSTFKSIVVFTVLLFTTQANAGLIFYSDQSAFETAVDAPLALEGFNDNELDYVQVQSGYIRYRTTSSLVSEGEKALVLRESNSITFSFDHKVFAFSLFVNELNSTNLNYFDSNGNELFDAFKVTDIWNASTFLGVTSDVVISSFTLVGSGEATALFGIDALQFTAANVNEPATWLLFSLLAVVLLYRRIISLS